jgi:hypothetical protein
MRVFFDVLQSSSRSEGRSWAVEVAQELVDRDTPVSSTLTLGVAQGAGVPDPMARPCTPGTGNGKAAPAKRAASRAASSLRREPSYQIVQRSPEDACISLERRRENHDRAIDDIGEAVKNVKVPGELVYNPGCLALARNSATWSGLPSLGQMLARHMTGPPTPSSSSSFTSSPSRPPVEINASWPIGSPWPSRMRRELGS